MSAHPTLSRLGRFAVALVNAAPGTCFTTASLAFLAGLMALFYVVGRLCGYRGITAVGEGAGLLILLCLVAAVVIFTGKLVGMLCSGCREVAADVREAWRQSKEPLS